MLYSGRDATMATITGEPESLSRRRGPDRDGRGRARKRLDPARGRAPTCSSRSSAIHGTIGGGQLEFMAIDQARQILADAKGPQRTAARCPARARDRPMLRRARRGADQARRRQAQSRTASGRGGRGQAAAAYLHLRRRPCRPGAGHGLVAAAGAGDRRRDPRRGAGRHAGRCRDEADLGAGGDGAFRALRALPSSF